MVGKLGAVAVVLFACLAGYGLDSANAEVIPAASGSLTMSSDPGDYVGQGLSYAYSVPATTFSVQNGGNLVRVDTSVPGSPGDFWNLAFQAPAGQQLQAGTTYQADRWPFQPSDVAGLEVFGQGRGCNTLTGNFTILDATYGPFGYLESFDATFSQHCEQAAPALHGEIKLSTPPPPPALALNIAANATGTVTRSGTVTVRGTVTCTQPVTLSLTGSASQTLHGKKTAMAQFSTTSTCTPTMGGTWQATLASSTGNAFSTGGLQLGLQAQATDPFYTNFTGTTITTQTATTSTVNLARS
jgi:hypothetical protein